MRKRIESFWFGFIGIFTSGMVVANNLTVLTGVIQIMTRLGGRLV